MGGREHFPPGHSVYGKWLWNELPKNNDGAVVTFQAGAFSGGHFLLFRIIVAMTASHLACFRHQGHRDVCTRCAQGPGILTGFPFLQLQEAATGYVPCGYSPIIHFRGTDLAEEQGRAFSLPLVWSWKASPILSCSRERRLGRTEQTGVSCRKPGPCAPVPANQ